eukprot:CAMPEP_0180716278 /NCGR_PEP_ID=MMETSP1038_2-20121128/13373_1 /TAXON_ID=632150 /ORGANISM="Azadinium spinosum, Strain 3D9" /LENGTH=474 /DNA_ID=CAMNT_0022748705 /DNA_START=60 /DNA_END=1481 /DNA_ORIENTATION=-
MPNEVAAVFGGKADPWSQGSGDPWSSGSRSFSDSAAKRGAADVEQGVDKVAEEREVEAREDEEEDDHEDEEAISPPRTRKDVVAVAQYCLKQWNHSVQKDLTRTLKKVRGELAALQPGPGQKPQGTATSPLARSEQSDSDLSKKHMMLLEELLQEARGVSEAADTGDREASQAIQAAPISSVVELGARECQEGELRRWWSGTIEKVASRTHDARDGKAFYERLGAALPHQDAEVAAHLVEHLQPLRLQLERHLQEELRPRLAEAGVGELRAAMRSGEDKLEDAVNNAMRKAAASWGDEKIRRAAERLHATTRSEAVSHAGYAGTADAVRGVLRPLVVAEVQRTGAGGGMVKSTAASAASFAAVQDLILARARTATRPLDDALQRLATRMELSKLETAVGGGAQPVRSGVAVEPPSEARISQLLSQGCFEEAFALALQAEDRHSLQGATRSLVEWTCDQALLQGDGSGPGAGSTD